MSPAIPKFEVPSGAVAKVSIIDSTLRLGNLPAEYLNNPPVEGYDIMKTLPTWSFLVESSTGQKSLFDLGVPLDLSHFNPAVGKYTTERGWKVDVKENVADILKKNGIDLKDINSVIWSHGHFDHMGDVTTFPGSTELVFGPGFKHEYYPGYPSKPQAPMREGDFKGRPLREIDFEGQGSTLKIGPFRAFDFFGDGSYYLLDTPGHAQGHLGGLARTSSGNGSKDTFIFMGGDLCHHGGEMRPSQYLPIPDQLPSYLRASKSGAAFRDLNVKRGRGADGSFFDPMLNTDEKLAIQTLRDAEVLDAQDNVWFVFAHDTAVMDAQVDLYPKTANAWKDKGWKERTHWAFLEDFTKAV